MSEPSTRSCAEPGEKNNAPYSGSTPVRSHPEVALKLLDPYFDLPDDFDHAQPHVDRAIALLALRRVNDTIAPYESALALEATALEHFGFRYDPSECRTTTGYPVIAGWAAPRR